MYRYKFTQHIPQGLGIVPKSYDFNTVNELVETDLFQTFQTSRFEIYEENGQPTKMMIYLNDARTPSVFGYITVNQVYIAESVKPATKNPFDSNMSHRELDMIKFIMNKPHIHISQDDLEQQANFSSSHDQPQISLTPEQRLGLL